MPHQRRSLALRALAAVAAAGLAVGVALRSTQRPDQLLALGPSLALFVLVAVPVWFVPKVLASSGLTRVRHVVAMLAAVVAAPLALAARSTDGIGPPEVLFALVAIALASYAAREWRDPSRTARRAVLGASATYGALVALAAANAPPAFQLTDRHWQPAPFTPAFAVGQGPVLCIDQGHHNFHRVEDGLLGLVKLLEADGYRVRRTDAPFAPATLDGCRVQVIASALHESDRWELPTPPALRDDEVAALAQWIETGGALLLLVDHMPFPGAVAPLARVLGFDLPNGVAMTTEPLPGFQGALRARFSRARGTLHDHPLLRARSTEAGAELAPEVWSFGGSAFPVPAGAEPLLTLEPTYVIVEPSRAWALEGVARKPAGGFAQGATKTLGRGRVAVFSEIAMFTTQLVLGLSSVPFGMNAPEAKDNPRFVRDVVAWLAAPPR